ncbi:MarR family protein [Aureliella helgolandensis]|uniref:MarR family protein n=2 Tax=Aureliella helgolandensis TaxID=2527968 RepID=A0A518GCH1_9BACT|nr:MarR family protein [Aureliella helgolandensis]
MDLLRHGRGLTVQDLTEQLEVTATAVRQRLERLVEADLIERVKESVGRGRPQFRYVLTAMGMRYASANYADLATALWQEIIDLPNPQQRGRILRRVAQRMAQGWKQVVPLDGNLDARFAAVAEELGRRKVPAVIRENGNLPILEVQACPYPELTGGDDNRHLCELEQEMLSEVIGQAMQLDCCRLDGHHHCQFRPVEAPTP